MIRVTIRAGVRGCIQTALGACGPRVPTLTTRTLAELAKCRLLRRFIAVETQSLESRYSVGCEVLNIVFIRLTNTQ